jgi:hypothetical protein
LVQPLLTHPANRTIQASRSVTPQRTDGNEEARAAAPRAANINLHNGLATDDPPRCCLRWFSDMPECADDALAWQQPRSSGAFCRLHAILAISAHE